MKRVVGGNKFRGGTRVGQPPRLHQLVIKTGPLRKNTGKIDVLVEDVFCLDSFPLLNK